LLLIGEKGPVVVKPLKSLDVLGLRGKIAITKGIAKHELEEHLFPPGDPQFTFYIYTKKSERLKKYLQTITK